MQFRIPSLLFALFLVVKMASAQDGTALLQQAADAYSNGDYQTAIDQYEQVLAGGQDAHLRYTTTSAMPILKITRSLRPF
ncbi:MAG: hypothetical protein R2788_12950 [Saprospiraceae bacterium]